MAQGRTTSASTKPPRFIRDGIDLYIHVDDLCNQLDSVPLQSPAQVATALKAWKASMTEQPKPQGAAPEPKARGRKKP